MMPGSSLKSFVSPSVKIDSDFRSSPPSLVPRMPKKEPLDSLSNSSAPGCVDEQHQQPPSASSSSQPYSSASSNNAVSSVAEDAASEALECNSSSSIHALSNRSSEDILQFLDSALSNTDQQQDQFEADKRMIYKHPLLPLLALLLEKCELATQSMDCHFSENLQSELQIQLQQLFQDQKSLLTDNDEINELMLLAAHVLKIHLLELEKVQELCKDFCNRYITCLKGKMQSENLLRSDYGGYDSDDSASGFGASASGNSVLHSGSRSNMSMAAAAAAAAASAAASSNMHFLSSPHNMCAVTPANSMVMGAVGTSGIDCSTEPWMMMSSTTAPAAASLGAFHDNASDESARMMAAASWHLLCKSSSLDPHEVDGTSLSARLASHLDPSHQHLVHHQLINESAHNVAFEVSIPNLRVNSSSRSSDNILDTLTASLLADEDPDHSNGSSSPSVIN